MQCVSIFWRTTGGRHTLGAWDDGTTELLPHRQNHVFRILITGIYGSVQRYRSPLVSNAFKGRLILYRSDVEVFNRGKGSCRPAHGRKLSIWYFA
jgi:hypothetical protein